MTPWQSDVAAFMKAVGQPVRTTPTFDESNLQQLGMQLDLICEEATEIDVALEDENFPAVIDGIADLIYVALGLANAAGVDMEPIFAAVHKANMEKLKGPKRADGKQLKPEGWQPPKVAALIEEQRKPSMWTAEDEDADDASETSGRSTT